MLAVRNADFIVPRKTKKIVQKNLSSSDNDGVSKVITGIFDFFFYILLAVIVIVIVLTVRTNNTPHIVLGYSVLTVLTPSMQSEIPQGSFVLTKSIDPNNLKLGDDITYARTTDSTVTHRIVGIYENYQSSGKRGFETKGIENSKTDQQIVMEENIVGKVIYHNLLIGNILSFVRKNVLVCVILGVIIIALMTTLQIVCSTKSNKEISELMN